MKRITKSTKHTNQESFVWFVDLVVPNQSLGRGSEGAFTSCGFGHPVLGLLRTAANESAERKDRVQPDYAKRSAC